MEPEVKVTHSELEKLVRTEAREEETTNITIVILPIDLPNVTIPIGSH